MVRNKIKSETNLAVEGKEKDKPKKVKKKRLDSSPVNIEIGDLSDVSGKVQVAGGDIVSIATPAEIDREYELREVAKLKEAILKKKASLDAQVNTKPDPKPFHATPLNFNENIYLVGRTEFVNNLSQKLKKHQTVVLSGTSGIGKTSVLQAGLLPKLLEEGYLPILISDVDQPLPEVIKQKMMSGIESTKYLWQLPLPKFLEHAIGGLSPKEKLLLVVDGFEKLAVYSSTGLGSFLSQWKDSKDNLQLKWLFSIDSGFSASIASFLDAEEISLPPLSRIAAAQAIHSLEKEPGELGDEYFKEILDGLEGHRETINGARINPSELQVVLEALSIGGPDKKLPKIYEDAKGLNGIFELFLINVVKTKFDPPKRRIIREILTILEDHYQTAVPVDWIESRIKSILPKDVKVSGLLAELKGYHILAIRDHAYELAGIRMKRAVLGWLHQQTILDQAEEESKKQLDRIRTSALRGLFGGAIGLVIFRWFVGTPVKDSITVIFYSLLYAALGGTVGLLYTFMIDIFVARNGASRSFQRYALSSTTGCVMFAIALVVYVYLGDVVEDDTLWQLLRAALVGGAWGTITGFGIAWALGLAKVTLWSSGVITLLGSTALYVFNRLFPVLQYGTPLEILIGGFLFTLVIVSAVLYRNYAEPV